MIARTTNAKARKDGEEGLAAVAKHAARAEAAELVRRPISGGRPLRLWVVLGSGGVWRLTPPPLELFLKSSQVANSHKAQINAPCKEPSTAKERTPHAARLKPQIKISPGAPSVYDTEWANPHGLTLVCGRFPPESAYRSCIFSTITRLCDIADSRATETKRCYPLCSSGLPGASPPKRRCPS